MGKLPKPTVRRNRERTPSVVWDHVNRGTALLYSRVIRSPLGRIMNGYRRADEAFAKGRRYPGRHRCTPMSPARLKLSEAVETGWVLAALRAILGALFACPTLAYGLFGLCAGLTGVALYFVMPLIRDSMTPSLTHTVLSGALAILSIPLAVSPKPLSEALGDSTLFRLILVRLLGIPRDRLCPPKRKAPRILPYIMVLLGLAVGVGTLWLHPAVIPLMLLIPGILGLILTYPEAGVVLSTLSLPVIWLDRNLLYLPAVLILVTWVSYGIKLLSLHRTIRFGLLDTVVLILGGVVLLSGFTGMAVTADTVLRGVLLFICLSDYFLIVNLMTTREYIRRCLVGVSISVALVIILSYLRIIPVDDLGWLEGSRAGNYIVDAVHGGIERLSGLWVEHSELFLVLVFPWLYAYLLHTRRVFRKVTGLISVVLALALIVMTSSISALLSVFCVTVIFFLLLDHKWLSVGLVSLPALGVGGWWLFHLFPVPEAVITILSRSRLFKTQLQGSLWRMVWDHPAGIGLGSDAFDAVYPFYAAPDLGAVTDSGSLLFEVLLSFGWIGLILFGLILFLFVQKSVTCLGHTSATKDRAMILGGVTSLVGALVFGTVRSFLTAPRVFFTLLLVVALCSAYENIIFDESDVLTANRAGSPDGEDRIYRRG